MKQLLSPKQVAHAIGVSESSLKRWVDQGALPSERTAGGHRRLRVGDVLQFLRQGDYEIVRPELLGLPPGTAVGPRNQQRVVDTLVAALKEGDAELVRRLVFNAFLAGGNVAELSDRLFAPAMHEIGNCWEAGHVDVYQEHRACEVLAKVLYEMRMMLPPASGPLALGGTPSGDHYRLATSMAELTLVEAGWRATSLGTSLPFYTLSRAIQQHRPQVFWLSVSHLDDGQKFVLELAEWLASVPSETRVVLGGRAVRSIPGVDDLGCVVCENFVCLRNIAATQWQSAREPAADSLEPDHTTR